MSPKEAEVAFFAVLISSRRQMTQRAAQAQITAEQTASGFKTDIFSLRFKRMFEELVRMFGRALLRAPNSRPNGRMMGREAGRGTRFQL